MEQEREECAFFFHIRRAATVLVLSMMSVFCRSRTKQRNAVSGARTQFVLANAENYKVPSNVSFYYFFNPFSVEILKSSSKDS